MLIILYIKIDVCLCVCMFVCTLYKSTFLNRSEPNFAHCSPLVCKRPLGMYGPEILDLFELLGPFPLGGTRWLPARPFSAIRASGWCSRDATDITLSLTAESFAVAIMVYDIFINCNWVATRWQHTFTHKQYIEQHK
jgi:hypothetical protein